MKNAIARKVHLPFNVIGENLKENIEKTLQLTAEWYLAFKENKNLMSFSSNQIKSFLKLKL